MSQYDQAQRGLPPGIGQVVAQLAERIRIARKRRALTMEEMAARMFVNRKTLSRLEKGDTGVSIAVFASALWVLGLEKDLLGVANPELDTVGIFRERQRLPKRVRSSENSDDLNF